MSYSCHIHNSLIKCNTIFLQAEEIAITIGAEDVHFAYSDQLEKQVIQVFIFYFK